jgi:hypothetical protein
MNEQTSVMGLLAAGVPVSLLMDLAVPVSSQEIFSAEGGDAGWLRATG